MTDSRIPDTGPGGTVILLNGPSSAVTGSPRPAAFDPLRGTQP